jgi:hypothetical protein
MVEKNKICMMNGDDTLSIISGYLSKCIIFEIDKELLEILSKRNLFDTFYIKSNLNKYPINSGNFLIRDFLTTKTTRYFFIFKYNTNIDKNLVNLNKAISQDITKLIPKKKEDKEYKKYAELHGTNSIIDIINFDGFCIDDPNNCENIKNMDLLDEVKSRRNLKKSMKKLIPNISINCLNIDSLIKLFPSTEIHLKEKKIVVNKYDSIIKINDSMLELFNSLYIKPKVVNNGNSIIKINDSMLELFNSLYIKPK